MSRLLIWYRPKTFPLTNAYLHFNYGDLLRELERYDEALEKLHRAVRIAENVSDLCYIAFSVGIANVHSLQEQHADAIQILESLDITKIKPYQSNYTELLYTYTNIYFRAGQQDKAMTLLTEAERNVSILKSMALIHLLLNCDCLHTT